MGEKIIQTCLLKETCHYFRNRFIIVYYLFCGLLHLCFLLFSFFFFSFKSYVCTASPNKIFSLSDISDWPFILYIFSDQIQSACPLMHNNAHHIWRLQRCIFFLLLCPSGQFCICLHRNTDEGSSSCSLTSCSVSSLLCSWNIDGR